MSTHQPELQRQGKLIPSTWTESMFDEAERLWGEGMPTSGIAVKIGAVSKNSVTGVAHKNPSRFPPRRQAPGQASVAHIKEEASWMWIAGVAASDIAKHFNVPLNVVENLISRNREMFPKRGAGVQLSRSSRKTPHPDRVIRVVCGESITLPRVTFIDGPYLAQAAE